DGSDGAQEGGGLRRGCHRTREGQRRGEEEGGGGGGGGAGPPLPRDGCSLSRELRGDRLDERAGAAAYGRRCAARRLQHARGPSGGRRGPRDTEGALVAPASRAVSGAREAAADYRRLPFLLRVDPGAEAGAVSDPES